MLKLLVLFSVLAISACAFGPNEIPVETPLKIEDGKTYALFEIPRGIAPGYYFCRLDVIPEGKVRGKDICINSADQESLFLLPRIRTNYETRFDFTTYLYSITESRRDPSRVIVIAPARPGEFVFFGMIEGTKFGTLTSIVNGPRPRFHLKPGVVNYLGSYREESTHFRIGDFDIDGVRSDLRGAGAANVAEKVVEVDARITVGGCEKRPREGIFDGGFDCSFEHTDIPVPTMSGK